tara:strand:+ start:915 stop:1763 length:849 start_codon:yes stop_codon:yes gene_type:complete
MKILLTGGMGFVGKHLAGRLLDEGYTFVNYDLVNGDDIRDKFKLDRLFESENFDAVINLAARAGVRRGEDFPDEYFSTNVLGLMNLIALSEKYGVKKFIHFSSSSAFGTQEVGTATAEGNLRQPRSIYGITKLAGELLLERSRLPYTIIRPFTIIGENGRKEMVIYKWLNQIKSGRPASFYGNGESYRGYTYIGDMIDGIITCLKNKNANYQTFNMGGAQIVTLEELWNIFKEEYPEAERDILPMPVTDQMYSLADTSKAEALLSWKAKTDVPKKIREMIKK